jgi:uncharacterized protein
MDAIISADSHVSEPGDLWTTRIAAAYRDRAPHMEARGDMGDFMVADGISPMPVGLGIAAPRDPKDIKFFGVKYEEARPGGWDPDARLKDQDIDGVSAEVLYPTLTMPMFAIPDGGYQHACFQAYNDWLADFCRTHPQRLVGIGLISLHDIDAAVSEVARIATLGLRGAMIRGDSPEDCPYGDPHYDPLWAALQDHHLPVSLHILTSGKRQSLNPSAQAGSRMAGVMTVIHYIQRSIADMIFNRVFERFPKLKVVSAENDIGWIAHYMGRMDHAYNRHRHWLGQGPLQMLPSEFFKQNVWATFMDDVAGMATRHLVGVDRLMWASDYPHSDSTWPESQAVLAKHFAGVPDGERRRIIADNARALYGID